MCVCVHISRYYTYIVTYHIYHISVCTSQEIGATDLLFFWHQGARLQAVRSVSGSSGPWNFNVTLMSW